MKFLMFLFIPGLVFAQITSETFLIKINDKNIEVTSPPKERALFSTIIENRSLSDQIGKFVVNGKTVKYVSVKSGMSDTVEIENKSKYPVAFIPVSPAFQEVELKFGKKVYEVPSKE